MTVRRLSAELDSAELSEWMAYDAIEPLPDPWNQHGRAMALMADLWGSGRRHDPEDFIPAKRRAAREQSGAEGLALFDAMFGAPAGG